jgi:superfamily II DNA/RNA helicase
MNKRHHSIILLNLGIENLNEMQEAAQETILNDTFCCFHRQVQGKPSFFLPILEMLQPEVLSVQCLILVPSRELGLQIEQVWKKWVQTIK